MLIQRRAAGAHQGGLWEFPGGKREPGESLADALTREVDEELGVRVLAHQPLIRLRHDYGDRKVLLDVHRVTRHAGEPRAREGQPWRWVFPTELPAWPMPAADRPIIDALRLPPYYAITPSTLTCPAAVAAWLENQLAAGRRLLQLRLPAFTPSALRACVPGLAARAHASGAWLLMNSADSDWLALGIDGLHLPARALATPPERLGWPSGASCHDAGELARAAQAGVTFALLSPVCATSSHPEARPLGWQAFARLVDNVDRPVYALGGLGAEDLARARAAGAQGIAGIRQFLEERGEKHQ